MHDLIEAFQAYWSTITHPTTGQYIGWSAVVLILIALFVRAGVKARRIGAVMARTPIVPIGSAAEGIVAIEGTAEALGGRLADAGLTGAKCVWYRWMTEHMVVTRSRSGRTGQPGWARSGGGQSYQPILLRDGSGVCSVCVDGDYVVPTDRSAWYGKTRQPAERQPPRYPGSVLPADIHAKLSGSEESYRYLEERIYPGDRVFVLGQLFKTPFDESATRERDDDEELGPHGWPGFDAKQFREAMREAAGVTSLRVGEPLDKSVPFVVSGIPLADAIRIYNRRSLGCFIPAAILAALLVALAWLHFLR